MSCQRKSYSQRCERVTRTRGRGNPNAAVVAGSGRPHVGDPVRGRRGRKRECCLRGSSVLYPVVGWSQWFGGEAEESWSAGEVDRKLALGSDPEVNIRTLQPRRPTQRIRSLALCTLLVKRSPRLLHQFIACLFGDACRDHT